MKTRNLLALIALLAMVGFAYAECGNNNCESGETFSSCPIDCTSPATIEVTVESPLENTAFLHGDNVQIKVQITVEGKKATSLDYITAYGFFGSIALYDDGDHNDNAWKDGTYSNSFVVGKTQPEGQYNIFISAKQGKTFLSKKIQIAVSPKLTAGLQTEKQAYYLGDQITFFGTLKRHETPLEKNLELLVFDAKGKKYSVPVETNEDGNFSVQFHTSLVDSAGIWDANFVVTDDLNNTGIAETTFIVKKPEDRVFLRIVLQEEPSLYYKRGSDFLLIAKVYDGAGKEIQNAELELETPLGQKIMFEKTDKNMFYAAGRIPVSMPSGKQSFFIHATATEKGMEKSGDLNVGLYVKEIGITLDLISPKTAQTMIGEALEFKIRANYEDGELLSERTIPATANGKEITLSYQEPGIYSGTYIVSPQDSIINFEINYKDPYNNSALLSAQIKSEGTSWIYYVRQYYYVFISAIAILLVIAWVLRKKIKTRLEKKSLGKEEKEVSRLLEKADKEYIEGKLTREEYNNFSAKYNAELVKVKNREKEIQEGKNAKNKKK